jgi:hypothetical protein
MQTFLPYPDFEKSAKVLDARRLGKQRLEAYQIIMTLLDVPVETPEGTRPRTGWKNHPAVRMWRGHEGALSDYLRAVCREWRARGYRDDIERGLDDFVFTPESFALPEWFGREDFHASHRSNLLRKDPVFYEAWGWTEPENIPYVWPR